MLFEWFFVAVVDLDAVFFNADDYSGVIVFDL